MPPSDPSLREEPWIETRAGGLFFVNVLLATPAALVLLPVVLAAVLRATGMVEGLAPRLDVIPAVGAYVAPWVGWLAAPAAWFAWRSRRDVERAGPRAWLAVFAALHVLVVAYTVWRWTGGAGGP